MSDFSWVVLTSIIMVIAVWFLRKHSMKYCKKAINDEKYYVGIMATLYYKGDQSIPPALTGKDAIQQAYSAARIVDLLFWTVLFSALIFIIFMWR